MAFSKHSTLAWYPAQEPAHFQWDLSENGFPAPNGLCDMNTQNFCQWVNQLKEGHEIWEIMLNSIVMFMEKHKHIYKYNLYIDGFIK